MINLWHEQQRSHKSSTERKESLITVKYDSIVGLTQFDKQVKRNV